MICSIIRSLWQCKLSFVFNDHCWDNVCIGKHNNVATTSGISTCQRNMIHTYEICSLIYAVIYVDLLWNFRHKKPLVSHYKIMKHVYVNLNWNMAECMNLLSLGWWLLLLWFLFLFVSVPPTVVHNDDWTWEKICHYLYEEKAFDNIVISPGPGSPTCPADIG